MMQSRDIILAKKAFVFITTIKKTKEACDIRTELEALPARIRINGLTQTLLFLLVINENSKDRKQVGRELVNFLSNGNSHRNYPDVALTLCQNDCLRKNTERVIAYSAWLKRFAKAEIPKDKDSSGDTDAK